MLKRRGRREGRGEGASGRIRRIDRKPMKR